MIVAKQYRFLSRTVTEVSLLPCQVCGAAGSLLHRSDVEDSPTSLIEAALALAEATHRAACDLVLGGSPDAAELCGC